MDYDHHRHERELMRDRAERGIVDRAGDEVRSWFGDDDAERRREMDERERERRRRDERWGSEPGSSERWNDAYRRRYSSDRPYGDRTHGLGYEDYRDYGDRYGRSFSSPIDRERAVPPTYGTYPSGSFGVRNWGPAYSREWSAEAWRTPGPFSGRGPRGYQRSDDRIREEVNDRLTAHGFVDATDIECAVHKGEVTLNGFVDSREAKRAAEGCVEDIAGVREVHNHLRLRPRNEEGVGRSNVLGLSESPTLAKKSR